MVVISFQVNWPGLMVGGVGADGREDYSGGRLVPYLLHLLSK